MYINGLSGGCGKSSHLSSPLTSRNFRFALNFANFCCCCFGFPLPQGEHWKIDEILFALVLKLKFVDTWTFPSCWWRGFWKGISAQKATRGGGNRKRVFFLDSSIGVEKAKQREGRPKGKAEKNCHKKCAELYGLYNSDGQDNRYYNWHFL